jgi:hypothetical protein
MRMVYIVVGALVVLLVAALGVFRWQQNQKIAAAYATPSPAPSSSKGPAPIQIVDGTAIGKVMIAAAKQSADTPKGGHGQAVDGIECATSEYATLHVHPHLALFYKGTQVQIPALVGISPTSGGGCLYWLHTHDATGLIHVEAPQLSPTGGTDYNLGMFFDIWGQTLNATNVAGLSGPVTAFLNGEKFSGDPRLIPLKSHNQITLEVGKVVTPPVYSFPPNE